MDTLLAMLYAIKFFSKDLHYLASGDNFYSDHKFCDEIADGLDEFIDQINEKMYLGNEHDALYSKEIVSKSMGFIPPKPTNMTLGWQNLYFLLRDTIELINTLEDEYPSAQLNALLDNIADDLQGKKGLIWRRKMAS